MKSATCRWRRATPAALTSYQANFAIADRLAKSDPGNAGWQRDLSVSYEKVGNVQVAQGNLPAALTSYQAGLAIRERLAKSDPGNAGWQRDLSVLYREVGRAGRAGSTVAGRALLAPIWPRRRWGNPAGPPTFPY